MNSQKTVLYSVMPDCSVRIDCCCQELREESVKNLVFYENFFSAHESRISHDKKMSLHIRHQLMLECVMSQFRVVSEFHFLQEA